MKEFGEIRKQFLFKLFNFKFSRVLLVFHMQKTHDTAKLLTERATYQTTSVRKFDFHAHYDRSHTTW